MTDTLKISSVASNGGSVITLSGMIDETFDGEKIAAGPGGVLAIDLEGVTRITSYGVREWVKGLRSLSGQAYIGFVRCRPALVSQFNMVKDFSGRGQLVSFYAPLICPSCSREFEQFIDLRRDHAKVKAFTLPEFRCPSCNVAARLEEAPESYLSFAASAPQPKPPALFDQLLSSNRAPPKALTVRKAISGNVTGIWLSGFLDGPARFKRLGDGLEGSVVVVCAGVSDVTDDGVNALASLVKTSTANMYLARVPTSLALPLCTQPDVAGKVRICSMLLRFICSRCGAQDSREGDLKWVNAPATQTPDDFVCGCGGALTPTFDPQEVRKVCGPFVAEPPAEVVSYLSAHFGNGVEKPGAGGSDDSLNGGEMFGRYQLLRQIGMGGMAEVMLARQTGMGGFEKKLAVKRILPHLSADPTFLSMFLQEARLAARISHPNVVQIFDLGAVNDRYFIAMEYVRGWDLAAVRRVCKAQNIAVPLELAAFMVARICAGLHGAHTCTDEHGKPRPVIHRDVSPHNVLVSTDGQVKLSDFGIAKALGTGSLTPTATPKGKLAYLSPEQVRGAASLDPRSDVFAVGVMLYELLTQDSLFRRDSEYATFEAVLYANITPLSKLRSDIPPEFDEIVEKALNRDPNDRYQTAEQFQIALERFLLKHGRSPSPMGLGTWLKQIMERDTSTMDRLKEHPFTPTSMRLPPRPIKPPPKPKEPMDPSAVASKLPQAKVLLVHGSPTTRLDACVPVLENLVGGLDVREPLGDLPPDGAYAVLIVNYDGLSADDRTRLMAHFADLKTTTRLLLISQKDCRSDFVPLFGRRVLTNLLGHAQGAVPSDLLVTLKKLIQPDIFGIERYFAPGFQVRVLSVANSKNKQQILEKTEEFATALGVHPRLVGQFISVADELFTNAIFNAPVDLSGSHRYASLSRRVGVALMPGEEIEIKLCSDDRRLGISVADPFGSLTRERLLDYLAKGFRGGEEQVDNKQGGAGLGFYMLIESLSHFVVNISQGKRTEVIGLLDVKGSYRDFAKASKSFSLFYE